MKRLFFFLLFCLSLSCAAHAAAYQPGFKTVGISDPAHALRLDLAVWYPSSAAPSPVDYGDWTFSAARGKPATEGMHPLILLSHDSAGSRFSLHQLAAALARNGFVAVALTHPGDNIDDMQNLFTPVQPALRAVQLIQTLNVILRDPETAPLIDSDRIGVLGVGPGGTAAILLAGGRLDPAGWTGYCTGRPESDPYCTPWARQRLDAGMRSVPKQPVAYRDRRIRVAAAIAPAYPMLFTKPSLSRIRIPLLLVRAEHDPIYTLENARRLLGDLPQPPQLVMLPGADPATLMSACGGNLPQTLPEMCRPEDASRRDAVQDRLAAEAVSFFLRHLGTPNPPPLPPEPGDQPEVKQQQHPAAPEKAGKKKRK